MEKAEKHSIFSSIREEYVEYIFLAELCSFAWANDRFVEVARSSTDAFGYDVILTCEGQTRHVQLKAMLEGGRARSQKVNGNLARTPSGCVVWLAINADTLQPNAYGWFGSAPGQALPDLGEKIARHNKGTSTGEKLPRPAIREVSKSRFEWLLDIGDVFNRLFGE